MTFLDAIDQRHSVRTYLDTPIEKKIADDLVQEIASVNQKSGLSIQAVFNDEKAYKGFWAHYGKFSGVRNYLIMAGKKSADLEEKVGYYGESLVLRLQLFGINSCWTAMTYDKNEVKEKVGEDERIVCVIAFGYGSDQGVPHESKPMEKLCDVEGAMPDWFRRGMGAAMKAPTAMNQQHFCFCYKGGKLSAKAGSGLYSKIDLGIAKYNFEIGAGKEGTVWSE
jgi:hypothetical protein